jgi:hypothetical protein
MYAVMLHATNTEFVSGIDRTFGYRTSRLRAVVAALAAAQLNRNVRNLSDLLHGLNDWRDREPNEYRNRGGTNEVFYRLWMETKQMLRNQFGMGTSFLDPAVPLNCPGSTLLNVYVPPGEGHAEICHGFAYRWAVAAGRIPETLSAVTTAFNAANSTPLLFPLGFPGYPTARVGGAMQVQPGDIIGMFTGGVPPVLGHSLIADNPPTMWFSANNAGTFGVGTGRAQINTAAPPLIPGHLVGWNGPGNSWMRPDGVALQVIYRR